MDEADFTFYYYFFMAIENQHISQSQHHII